MIRTHKIACRLNRALADALNLASGSIYTGVLVAHWRIVRKKGIWLSEKAGTRLSDSIVDAPMHAHTIDAAQQGFYKACKTTKALKQINSQAKYPHWPKKFRTTVWKKTALKFRNGRLELSNGRCNPNITIDLPAELHHVLSFQECPMPWERPSPTMKNLTTRLVVAFGIG